MKKLFSAIAVAATVLVGSLSGAWAACTGPAVMHDFPGTSFNMSLVTAQDGNCASNVGLNTSTAGAMVAGVAVDGWNVTEGTKADAAWVSGSGSIVSILKNIANGVAGSVPVTVNGTPTALTGLTPGASQTGIIIAANVDATSKGGVAYGAMANYGTSPGAVKVDGVNAFMTSGNLTQWGGTNVLAGTGAQAAGSPRVTVATDQATNAGAALVKGGVGVVNGGSKYQLFAASTGPTTFSAPISGGATGDYLSHCTVIPTTTSPGVVTILDNATTVYAFPGGASSLSNLVPWPIPIGANSTSGAWKLTLGAGLSVVCEGA